MNKTDLIDPSAKSATKASHFSLTARVTLFVALAIGISLVLIVQLVQSAVHRHFVDQDAEELQEMTTTITLVLSENVGERNALVEALSRAITGYQGVFFEVRAQDDAIIYSSFAGDLSALVLAEGSGGHAHDAHVVTAEVGNTTFRAASRVVTVAGQQFRISTALDTDFHLQFMSEFRSSLWLIMILAGSGTILAAWLAVRQGHAPVRHLSDSLRTVQADRLSVRLDPNAVPMELRDLVSSFNLMLGRLEESFARLTHFSADIAHELRTPLTNIITQTQVGLSKARSENEYKELLYSNLEEQERLAKMVNDMLWLAKSDHGLLKPDRESLDLAKESQAILDFFELLAEEKGIVLSLEGSASKVMGDRSLLRRALSNLVSNAIRYSSANQTVKVTLANNKSSEITLSVSNCGPQILPENQSKLFDRFYRVDPARVRQSDGAGLGLAIVKSIVVAHGGRVTVSSNESTTQFTLHLPQ